MRSETRTIQQAFRFELDPNLAQRALLAKSVGASRYVYNWGLAESKRQYELTGKRPAAANDRTSFTSSQAHWQEPSR